MLGPTVFLGKQGIALLTQQSCTQLPQEVIWQLRYKGLTQKVQSILQPKYFASLEILSLHCYISRLTWNLP